MKRASFIKLLFFLLLLDACVPKKEEQTADDNLSYIDPTIGNVGQLLQPTRPTVQLPNQMMRMFPIRQDALDDRISSFPLLIVSHRLGEAFSIKPSLAAHVETTWNSKMPYDSDLEETRPWYYSTYLVDDEVEVEFVPGKKVGYYRFHFPKGKEKRLLLGTYNQGASNWSFRSDQEVTGMETYHGDIKVYLYGTFSTAAQHAELEPGKRVYLTYTADADSLVEFKYAVSYISPEQAKKNYEHELGSTSFDQLKDQGRKAWADVIDQIQVEGGTIAQKRSFYTALYRTYERMVDITEDGQYYSGFDKQIHQTDRPFYVDDWTWDTYLAHHPLRTILHPQQEEDMLNSYVTMYEQGGWLPTFPVLFGDHACMNGFHSTIAILDAYRKGLRNFDVEKAYEAMRKNATEATMLPWRNGPKCELDDFYQQKGYFPALHPGEKETVALVDPFEKRQAVAVTLGNSYDDWALAEMAKELKKESDYQLFKDRAFNYKNLWSAEHQLFMPKDKDGNWIEIDPKFDGGMGGRDYYDENNGWTYAWQVQQDIPGLIELNGGKAKFEAHLDQLFREGLGRSKYEFNAKFPDATGLIGQHSMGNEPSFHIPYLYNFTDAPWKTQKRVRILLDTWFKDNIFGIPGDEDGGGMTAFVVFSSMGFYPVTPGKPVYTIGSPLFEKVAVRLNNGKTFTLLAHQASVKNKYIQSAKLNGKVLNKPWFTHEDLVNGGTLELEMGPKPNKNWGID